MVDIEFLGQMIESMAEAVERLEDAVEKKSVGDSESLNRLKVFIFDLHNKIEEALAEV